MLVAALLAVGACMVFRAMPCGGHDHNFVTVILSSTTEWWSGKTTTENELLGFCTKCGCAGKAFEGDKADGPTAENRPREA